MQFFSMLLLLPLAQVQVLFSLSSHIRTFIPHSPNKIQVTFCSVQMPVKLNLISVELSLV
jgi:hypothetical protein